MMSPSCIYAGMSASTVSASSRLGDATYISTCWRTCVMLVTPPPRVRVGRWAFKYPLSPSRSIPDPFPAEGPPPQRRSLCGVEACAGKRSDFLLAFSVTKRGVCLWYVHTRRKYVYIEWYKRNCGLREDTNSSARVSCEVASSSHVVQVDVNHDTKVSNPSVPSGAFVLSLKGIQPNIQRRLEETNGGKAAPHPHHTNLTIALYKVW